MKLTLKEIKKLLSYDPSIKRSTLKVSLDIGKALDNEPEIYNSSS
jgi:hypothetical protein